MKILRVLIIIALIGSINCNDYIEEKDGGSLDSQVDHQSFQQDLEQYKPYCGNKICDFNETIESCFSDCRPKPSKSITHPEQLNPQKQIIDPPGD